MKDKRFSRLSQLSASAQSSTASFRSPGRSLFRYPGSVPRAVNRIGAAGQPANAAGAH
jgi:hypothetical protein